MGDRLVLRGCLSGPSLVSIIAILPGVCLSPDRIGDGATPRGRGDEDSGNYQPRGHHEGCHLSDGEKVDQLSGRDG